MYKVLGVVVAVLTSPIWVPFVIILLPVWLVAFLIWTTVKGVRKLLRGKSASPNLPSV